MLDQKSELPRSASEIVGDLSALLEQLGAADGFGRTPLEAACSSSVRIESLFALREFVEHYTSQVLIPHELPAVARAYQHATKYQIRELLNFDLELGREPFLEQFRRASRAVGRNHLQRLRPLRDERLVQRYLKAVEAGEAHAWHTVVFGLVLALFSVPLRQGLIHFAQQTLGGFVLAANGAVQASAEERQKVVAAHFNSIGKAIELLLAERQESSDFRPRN
jgi:urease accessory protein UreF